MNSWESYYPMATITTFFFSFSVGFLLISELNWFAEWSRKQQKEAKHSPLWGSEPLDLCPRRNVGEATALKKGEEESQGNASLLQLLASFFFLLACPLPPNRTRGCRTVPDSLIYALIYCCIIRWQTGKYSFPDSRDWELEKSQA